MISSSSRSNHMSLKLVPCTNSRRIYSVPAALSGVGKYLYTLGIGSPKERSKSIVATSLATEKYLGIVAGYGIRATIWKPQRMVMRKVRLNPPSASFSRSTISSGLRLMASAASRHSSSTLKTNLRSAWGLFRLYFPFSVFVPIVSRLGFAHFLSRPLWCYLRMHLHALFSYSPNTSLYDPATKTKTT